MNSSRFPFFTLVLAKSLICAGLLLGGLTTVASAQSKTPTADQKDSKDEKKDTTKKKRPRRVPTRSLTRESSDLLAVFKPLAISASESTVKIMNGSRQIAVGTIVDSDGLVLTKASEITAGFKCKLPDGTTLPGTVFGIDTQNDLALLKIEATGLAVAPLTDQESPTQGSWVISPINESGKISIGVVAVDEREIPKSRAFMGIRMEDTDKGVRITEVLPNTPAAEAKLKSGDFIQKMDNVAVADIQQLRKIIGQNSPENLIRIAVLRKDEKIVLSLTLADSTTTDPMRTRSRTQNSMGSRLSRRAKDFPLAFQHDTTLDSNECGGPIVDIEGRIVGINIAREGRVSSLAIPSSVALKVIEKLKTGEHSPLAVYADRIKFNEIDLKDLRSSLTDSMNTLNENENKLRSQQGRIDELERTRKELSARISELYDERDSLKKSDRSLKRAKKQAEKDILNAEKRLKALKAGYRD